MQLLGYKKKYDIFIPIIAVGIRLINASLINLWV